MTPTWATLMPKVVEALDAYLAARDRHRDASAAVVRPEDLKMKYLGRSDWERGEAERATSLEAEASTRAARLQAAHALEDALYRFAEGIAHPEVD